MLRIQKQLLAAIAIFICTIPLAEAARPNIEGTYTCTTDDPFYKSIYTSTTKIMKNGDTYNFIWDYPEAKMKFIGTGFFMRGEDNFMAVIYANNDHKEETGVSMYKVLADGSLEGQWTALGRDKVGTETCKKQN